MHRSEEANMRQDLSASVNSTNRFETPSEWLPKLKKGFWSWRRRKQSKRIHKLNLQYEALEVRVVPSSTYTWTGAGANNNWSTVGNWSGGAAPTNGGTLVFGSGESQLTNVDDISGLSVAEVKLAGGYSISGAAITLTGSSGIGIDNQTGTNAFNNPITLGAGLTFEQDAGQLTLGGVVSGSQTLTTVGAGTLVLTGANTYSGATTVSAGTLRDGVANALPTTTTLTVQGSGTFDLAGFAQTVAGLADGGVSTGTVTDSAAAAMFTVNDVGANTFSGLLSGALSVAKTGSGALTLSHANTYTGSTTISTGRISISADNNLGAVPGSVTPASLTINGGALAATATFTLNANRGIGLGASGGTIDVAASTILTYNGIAAGTSGLTKIDTGTLVLGGVNTYSGATTISAGVVSVGVSNPFINTVAVTIGAGSELDLSGGISIASPITSVHGTGTTGNGAIVNIAGTNILTGPITLAGNTTIGTNAGQLTLSGVIGDNGLGYGVTLAGGGTFVFSGSSSNTYTGTTTLTTGTLELSKTAQNAIASSSLIIGNGVSTALVQETTSDQIYNSAVVTVNSQGTLDLNNHNDAIYGIVMAAGTVQTGTGLLTIYGTVTTNASSTTSVISGNLALSTANFPSTTFNVGLGTVPLVGPDLAVSAKISGAGAGITKTGAGTLVLSGTNTYTGATLVNGGTLLVNGSQSASAVTVNNISMLGGTNGTAGNISIAGGTLSPGVVSGGSGILNSGNVSFATTSAYSVNLDGTTPGSGYDQLNATGTVTLGPFAILEVTTSAGFAPAVGSTFVIIQSTNAISGTFPAFPEGAIDVVGGLSFQVSYKNDDVTLTYVAATATTLGSSLNASIYGQSVTFTATVSNISGSGGAPTGSVEFYNGSNALGAGTTLNGSGTSATSTFTISTLAAGSYPISAVYTTTGTLLGSTSSTLTQTVNQAPLTITASNLTKVYGGALPSLTASYSGLVNGDTSASLTTQPTLSTTGTAHSDTGVYTITASGAIDSNYSISYVNGSLIVTAAPLTITAGNRTKAYGAVLPTLTASYSGFVDGDTAANLTTQPTLTTTAIASSHVGTYAITASAAADPDYTISYVGGTLSVTQAELTVTAVNQTKVYGAAVPSLTASYSGFVNGDTAASLTTQPTLTTTATASSHVSGNPYSITASGAADADYAITYAAGSLTVTTAALTITANNQTMVYGAALPTLTASYSGFVNGDTSASLTTQPTLSTTGTASSNSGTYSITGSAAADADYSISYVAGSLTITQAALTITANNQSKIYGANLPALTVSYTGFVNGDGPAALDTVPTVSTAATATSDTGAYAINVSNADAIDYAISYGAGTLTVTPASLTISAHNQTKFYGAALPALTATYTGFVNGDTSASLTTQPTLTTTATASSHVAGSPYTITAGGAVDADYSIAYATGALTVTPVTLTIKANNQNKVYGAASPALTASYTGFVNGDTAASLTTQPALTTTATASSHVSGNPYTITAAAAVDSDYTIGYSPGILTVTPAGLTITAGNQTKVYGAALPTLTAGYTGFVNGDTPASLTTQPTLSTTATTHSDTGVYASIASGAVDTDYSFTYVAGSLTVTPAALLITAANQTNVYGAALPTLTASYSGFVDGDTAANLNTQPTLSTTATASSHVGTYDVTAIGAADRDYTISYVDGTLTVTPAGLTITAVNQTKVYGVALPTLTSSYSGFVNGDTAASLSTQPTLTTTASASSHVSGNPFSITASGAADSDYSITYLAGSLTVTTAALTITADNQTMVYGAAMPALTASYSGFVNGDSSASLTTQPALSTTAASTSDAGAYPITASGAADPDYSISYVAGALAITKAPLLITADNQTKVYGAGLPTLTVSYSGFVNGDGPAALDIAPTIRTTVTATSDTGVYAITVSNADAIDYAISFAAGTLTVSPATLTVTANNLTRPQGEANPPLTYVLSGLVNSDTASVVSGAPSLSTTATILSLNGPYPITIAVGTLSAANYDFITVGGTLTVANTPATTITLSASPGATSTYGQALTFTATVSATVNGDPMPTGTVEFEIDGSPIGSAVTLVNGSATSDSLSSPDAGGHTIEAIYEGSNSYETNTQTMTQTVTPAALTITADNQTKLYGADLPALTASYSGFVNGDSSASFTTQPTLSATGTAHSDTGVYAITASGTVDPNYAIAYVAGNLTVNPAALLITAANQTKAYGAALPTLTASYSGFVDGDTAANLSTQPTLSTTAIASSSVATYGVSASGAADRDYTISYVAGTLTVTPAGLTITAVNQNKVYGAAVPSLAASYAGFVNGDTAASLTTQPTLTTTANASSDVSVNHYSITASGATDSDYSITYVAGSLMVTTAPLTITAAGQTMVYGAALPTLTASYSGFVNGDTSASLTTQPNLSTTATASSDTGTYAITASASADADYSISYVAGSLTITKAPLTITANNQSKVYGANLPALTVSYTGFVNGDGPAALDTAPTVSTTATATSDTGAYAINVSNADAIDYAISYGAGTLTVTPASLTITPNHQTKPYGAAMPSLTARYSGFVNGDTSASLTTQPTLTTTATANSHVSGSPYIITASGAMDSDYSIAYATGTLTVTPDTLTIRANNQNKVYGAALPSLTASYTGFVNGDTAASLTTQPAVSTTATASSHVSGNPYTITAAGAVDSDYTIGYSPGLLTVTPAGLTITAGNQTKVYGAALPSLTAGYTGFVNGDTSASLTIQPTLSTTATTHSDAGVYASIASNAADPDYTISYVAGNLTVTPAALLITAVNQTMVYGAALPTLTASYSGFVDGDTAANLSTLPTLSTTAIASSHVGSYGITASAAADPDYTISYLGGAVTVTTAALTITANNQTKAYGAALPSLTASYAGFVNGDTAASLTTHPSLTTTATASSHVSSNPQTISATGAVDANYSITYVAGSLVVTPVALTITPHSQSKVYGANMPILTARYSGFVNGDTSASLTTQPTLGTAATAGTGAGDYPINASGAADPDYSISSVAGTLDITQAPLLITANNQTKYYGADLPTLTVSYTGFVNGDTAASFDTRPTLSTTATAASDIGAYAITASGAADPDYTISYVGGTLTVVPATTVTVAAAASAPFSNYLQVVQLSATVIGPVGVVGTGTETFSILEGTTTIGSPVTVSVSAGAASASYELPASTPVGTYTIQAVYSGTAELATSIDTSHSLSVSEGPLTAVSISILWGTDSALLYPTADGALLPIGRTTDMPWFNIDAIAVTFDSVNTVTPSDVTVTGVKGGNYGPVTITGLGTSHLICYFAKPITGPDILTITVTFAGVVVGGPATLPVLPGDVNDDGNVNSTDGVQILRSYTPANPYNIFDDLNGDGVVNVADFNLYRPQIGTVLPTVATPSFTGGGASGGAIVATAVSPPTATDPAPPPAATIKAGAVAAGASQPQASAVVLSTVSGAPSEEALDVLQVPAIVKESRAKSKRHESSKQLRLKGHKAEGVRHERIVVTYRPESSSDESRQLNDFLLHGSLLKKDHA
jgi:autotransporter-associated beta strand protein